MNVKFAYLPHVLTLCLTCENIVPVGIEGANKVYRINKPSNRLIEGSDDKKKRSEI